MTRRTLLLLILSISFASVSARYMEKITLIDGSEIYGLITEDNLNTGEIKIAGDYAVTSVPAKDVEVKKETFRPFQLEQPIIDWLSDYLGSVPNIVTFATITMTGEYCNPKYLLYDQALSGNETDYDKLLLEDGDILKYADLTPHTYLLNWKNVATVDRISDKSDYGIIDIIEDYAGTPTEGFIRTQKMRDHRKLETEDGSIITFQPKTISSIKKKCQSADRSIWDVSPVTESLVLEASAGGGRLDGIIIENNRRNRYFLILTIENGNEVEKKVNYSDINSIQYSRR